MLAVVRKYTRIFGLKLRLNLNFHEYGKESTWTKLWCISLSS